MKTERVQKIISNNTHISRRKAEDLIREGKVRVNNETINIGATATEKDKIEVNGDEIKKTRKTIIAIDKEKGYVTSTKDPHEKTIMKTLPQKYKDQNLKPAGRLDKDTTGLLILTNDGDLANWIMHPSNNIKKTYEGKTTKELKEQDLKKLREGIKLDERIAKCEARKINDDKFEIILQTGWTRQIRRMLEAIGHEVIELRRTKIGNLNIKDLNNKPIKEYNKQELTDKITRNTRK